MIKESSPTPRINLPTKYWRSFRAQLVLSFGKLVLSFGKYEGVRNIKAEMIEIGVSTPKDIPRDRRYQICSKTIKKYYGIRHPMKLETAAAGSPCVAIGNMGGDVAADLMREGIIADSDGYHYPDQVIQKYEEVAILKGWKQ